MQSENTFVHSAALCESNHIGERTRIWAFAHILPKAKIGNDCNICDGVFVENDVIIGNRVTIKCGVQLWDGTRVGDDVFIGPNATFTNDNFPRSKKYPDKFDGIIIENGASIGANSTILPGIRIGARAMVGAGAVVTKDVPTEAIVVGNPARISGYVIRGHEKLASTTFASKPSTHGTTQVLASSAKIIQLPEIADLRGKLSFAEIGQYLPFAPERYFLVYDVPNQEIRGEHAHKECHQFLIAAKGSITVIADNGQVKDQIILNSPAIGLHIPPMVWGIQFKYSQDAVLLVLASKRYSAKDYIRNYSEFQQMRQETNEQSSFP